MTLTMLSRVNFQTNKHFLGAHHMLNIVLDIGFPRISQLPWSSWSILYRALLLFKDTNTWHAMCQGSDNSIEWVQQEDRWGDPYPSSQLEWDQETFQVWEVGWKGRMQGKCVPRLVSELVKIIKKNKDRISQPSLLHVKILGTQQCSISQPGWSCIIICRTTCRYFMYF